MSKHTANWDIIGDRYYRREQIYTEVFDPDIELENYLVVAAPYGGTLALHKDRSKVYAYRASDDSNRSTIDIYSPSGQLIRQITWDKAIIKGIGWSEDEKLLLIAQDGSVRCYTGLSDDFTPFSLGQLAEDEGVISVKFWNTGFVALLGNNQLVAINRYDEPRPRILATPPSDEIISWTLIPPAYTLSRSVEVLLSIGQTINVVDASDSEDRMLQNGPFRHISVSPNAKFVALYTDDGKVWVISSDFQEKFSEYDTKSKTVPKDMTWCGNDAVALAWEDEVHLLGPNGAASKYYFDAFVHLIPEIDGIRLYTNDVCEFFQRVPDVVEDVFKPGSTSPASILLDAVHHLENRNPKADDNIQLIKPNLIEAIDGCISAAGHEFSTTHQKTLMRAASFGKNCLELYDPSSFVDMATTIRILNAVRHHTIGLPLSFEQYSRLSPDRLVSRLLSRKHHLVAIRLAESLNLPLDVIYIDWSRQKIRTSPSLDDNSLSTIIVNKLRSVPDMQISFEDIATTAYAEGRAGLATLLLSHEPMPAKQVPLLLNMSEDLLALDKAIESGDTDLILYVLLRMRGNMPLASFFRAINERPEASALVEATARDRTAGDRELLKDLCYQDDRRIDGAMLLFSDSVHASNTNASIEDRNSKLRMATKLATDVKDSYIASAMDSMARLQKAQQSLRDDPSIRASGSIHTETQPLQLKGLSLNETISTLIQHNHTKRALQLQRDFKVSERTFTLLRLRALVSSRSWRELEDWTKNVKKSATTAPGGVEWETFVNQILNAGNRELAGQFVGRCTGLEAGQRAEMYVKCGMIVRAAEEAVKAKDVELVERIRGLAGPGEVNEVERLSNTMRRR